MFTKLFVGGLPFVYSKEELTTLFAGAGKVLSAAMVHDPDRNRTRGFGFVEMSTPEEAQAAIATLNGMKVGERAIFVTQAREKPLRGQPPPKAHDYPKIVGRKTGRAGRAQPTDRPPILEWPPNRPGGRNFRSGPPRGDFRKGPGEPGWGGDGKRSFGAPRNPRGNFGPSRPDSRKPPKKAFWQKFSKKKPTE